MAILNVIITIYHLLNFVINIWDVVYAKSEILLGILVLPYSARVIIGPHDLHVLIFYSSIYLFLFLLVSFLFNQHIVFHFKVSYSYFACQNYLYHNPQIPNF